MNQSQDDFTISKIPFDLKVFYEGSYVLLRDGFANIRSLLSCHRRNLPFTLAIRLTHSRLLSGEQCITCQAFSHC